MLFDEEPGENGQDYTLDDFAGVAMAILGVIILAIIVYASVA